jgi:hypothetical protein
MSTQEEHRLDNFPGEVRDLGGKMKGLLPEYVAALAKLCRMPEEFKRRFWVSQVQALVQKVRADYKN